MSTSDPKTALVGVLTLLAAFAVGCDDPTAERLAPREGRLLVMLDLDPAADTQPMWITTFDLNPPDDVVAELWSDDTLVSTAIPEALYPCRLRYNGISTGITGQGGPCFAFPFRPTHGKTYELVVHSRNRPTLTARTTVPGDFDVVSGVVEGDPPGTEILEVTWTHSEPSHRYIVFVMDRSWGLSGLSSSHQSRPLSWAGWTLATTDTAVSTYRPMDEVWDGKDGDWVVAVYAVDRALFDFITSGSSEGLFPVAPASNIVNGYGFVGSWVRKYIPVDSFPLP